MATSTQCDRCGADLAAFVTEGFCTACLLEKGLGSSAAPSARLSRASPLGGFGEYELLEEIARGGMGVIYKARQTRLDRTVALKMILTGHLAGPTEVKRFLEEARTVATLQHPNIVAIHEVGENDGQHFFSMDYVEGQNLAQLVRENPLPATRAASYVRTIAEAVQYAHEHGVLHRDLKPSNVLLDTHDVPHVTDFGLAKRLTLSHLSPQTSDLTLTGQVLGSPNFMPPEQAAGRPDNGPASDVYSLGAILYHLITGRPPFLADTMTATLRLVAEAEPTAPRLLVPTVPHDLETICLKCLEKEPARRYASAAELAEDLGRFLSDDPIRARPASRMEKLARWGRHHPALALVSTVALLLVIAIVTVSTTAAIRLKASNRAGQEKLRQAYLSQARANRWSGRVGRRFDSLDALQKAADIRPGIDLRNEAIAAMTLVDVRPVKSWPLDPAHCYQVFDPRFERHVRIGPDGTITLHRSGDDQPLLHWPGTGYRNYGTIFSPNGRFLAVSELGESSTAFWVYDLSDKGRTVFQSSDSLARSFRFSADSKKLAVAWKANPTPSVSIYQTEDWRQATSFPARSLPSAVYFNPAGDLLAVSCLQRWSVKIYNAQSGEVVDSLAHSNGVHCVSWDPTGKLIATSCEDRTVYLWDLSQSPARATRLSLDAIAPYVSFNHRGDMLVTGDWHGWAKLWNVGSGKESLRWPIAYGLPVFNADDDKLAYYPSASRMEVLQLSSAEECKTLHFDSSPSAGTYDCAYSPDGEWLVSSHKDGLRIWTLGAYCECTFIPHGDTRALHFTRDPPGLITSGASGPSGLQWWPISTIQEGETKHVAIGLPKQVGRESSTDVNPANRIAFADQGTACLIDTQTKRVERRIATTAGVNWAALSPDGRQCATWSLAAIVVEVWNANDGSRMGSLAAPNARPFFSGDGRWIVTASGEEFVFWDRTTWARVHSIASDKGSARLDFSPDGRLFALSVGRGRVELFNAATFGSLAKFETPEMNTVSGIAFSPDNTQMAVCTSGPDIQLWNLRSIRHQLAAMKLDFDAPPIGPATNSWKVTKITVTAPPTPAE